MLKFVRLRDFAYGFLFLVYSSSSYRGEYVEDGSHVPCGGCIVQSKAFWLCRGFLVILSLPGLTKAVGGAGRCVWLSAISTGLPFTVRLRYAVVGSCGLSCTVNIRLNVPSLTLPLPNRKFL